MIVGMIGILRPAKIGGIAVRHAAVAVLAVIPVAAAHAPVGLAVRHQAAARGAGRVVGRAVCVVIAPIPVVDELPDIPGHVITAVTICPICGLKRLLRARPSKVRLAMQLPVEETDRRGPRLRTRPKRIS